MLRTLRAYRFRTHFSKYAARLYTIGTPISELADDSPYTDCALSREPLFYVGVRTTAELVAINLVHADQDGAAIVSMDWQQGRQHCHSGDVSGPGDEMVTPPMPVFLTMIADLVVASGATLNRTGYLSLPHPSGPRKVAVQYSLASPVLVVLRRHATEVKSDAGSA